MPGPVSSDTVARVLTNPGASLKRIAWAYGCARRGSDEERELRAALLARATREADEELRARQATELAAPLACGCAAGAHPPFENAFGDAAERDGRVCRLGWRIA